MVRGPASMLGLRVVVLGVLVAATTRARADAPVRVLVRSDGALAAALFERLRGHTSDLPLELVAAGGGPLEAEAAAQAERALALGRAQGCAAALWLDFVTRPGHAALVLSIALPASGRVLVRTIADARPRRGRSGPSSFALEAAALAARSELAALVERGEIAPPPSAPTTTPPAPPSPTLASRAPPVTAAATAAANAEARPRRRRVAARLAVGWQEAFDGVSPAQSAFVARAGVAYGRWEAGVGGTVALPARLGDELATVELARHGVNAYAACDLVERPSLRLDAGAAVGWAGFERRTVATAPGVVAAPPRLSSSLALGLELAAAWQPPLRRRPLALALAVGADYLPGAPELRYLLDGRAARPRQPWYVQPRLTLTLALRLP